MLEGSSTYLVEAIITAQDRASLVFATTAERMYSVSKGFGVFGNRINDVGGRLAAFSNRLIQHGSTLQMYGMRLITSLTVPLTLVGTYATKTFLEIEKSWTRLQKVLPGNTPQEIRNFANSLRPVARQLSEEFGFAQEKVVDAFTEIAKAGITTKKDIATLAKIAAETAVEFDTDLPDAVNFTIKTMLAFGLSANKTRQALATLDKIADETTASEKGLGEAISIVGGFAKVASVDIRHLGAMIAALEGRGISASEGANMLKFVLSRMVDPTKQAAKAIKEFGIDLNSMAWKGLSGSQKMEVLAKKYLQVREAAKQSGVNIKEWIKRMDQTGDVVSTGNAKLNAFAAIMGELVGRRQVSRLVSLLDDMANGFDNDTKSVSQYQIALKNTSNISANVEAWFRKVGMFLKSDPIKWQRLGQTIRNAAASLGEALLPHLMSAAKWLGETANKFSQLDRGTQKLIITVGVFLAAIGGVAKILGSLVSVAGMVGTVFTGIMRAIGTVTIGLAALIKTGGNLLSIIELLGMLGAGKIIAGIGLLAVAIYGLYKGVTYLYGYVTGADAATGASYRLSRARDELARVTRDYEKAVRSLKQAEDDRRQTQLDVERAEINLARARENYAMVLKDSTASELDRQEALLNVKQAEEDLADAKQRHTDAISNYMGNLSKYRQSMDELSQKSTALALAELENATIYDQAAGRKVGALSKTQDAIDKLLKTWQTHSPQIVAVVNSLTSQTVAMLERKVSPAQYSSYLNHFLLNRNVPPGVAGEISGKVTDALSKGIPPTSIISYIQGLEKRKIISKQTAAVLAAGVLQSLTGSAWPQGSHLGQTYSQGLGSTHMNSVKMARTIRINTISNLGGSASAQGSQIGSSWIGGIANSIRRGLGWVARIAKNVYSYLAPHTPPGIPSDFISKSGFQIGTTWVSGVAKGVESQLSNVKGVYLKVTSLGKLDKETRSSLNAVASFLRAISSAVKTLGNNVSLVGKILGSIPTAIGVLAGSLAILPRIVKGIAAPFGTINKKTRASIVAIAQFLSSLSSVTKVFGSLGKNVDLFIKSLIVMPGTIIATARKLIPLFRIVYTAIKPFKTLKKETGNIIATVGKLLSAFGLVIKELALLGSGNIFNGKAFLFIPVLFNSMLKSLSGFIAIFKTFGKKVRDNIAVFTPFLTALSSFLKIFTLVGKNPNLTQQFLKILSSLPAIISALIQNLVRIFKSLAAFKGNMQKQITVFTAFLTALGSLVTAFLSLGNNISFVVKALETIPTLISNLSTKYLPLLANAGKKIGQSWIKGIINAIKNGLAELKQIVTTVFSYLKPHTPPGIPSDFVLESGLKIGKTWGAAVARGMESQLGNIKDAYLKTIPRTAAPRTAQTTININFGTVNVRSDADIDAIVNKVSQALGRQAQLAEMGAF